MSEVGRDQILPSLLNADHERSRDEPEIAANIATQLEHMGLSTWSISVLRRLRDAIGRQEPKTVLEVGGVLVTVQPGCTICSINIQFRGMILSSKVGSLGSFFIAC